MTSPPSRSPSGSSPRGTIHVADDLPAAANAVAERVVAAYEAALLRGAPLRLGLSGGQRVHVLYERLAGPLRPRLDWTRVEIHFADDRAVPPDDERSNYRLVRETLVEPAGMPPGNVHRFRGEADDLEAAAREYEPLLAQPLDLLLLGVGPDGHTASLMPGSPLLREYGRRAAAVLDSPNPPPRRLTVTPRTIGEARDVAVLVTGADRADAVARALAGDEPIEAVPARLLRGFDWYLDRASAARLPHDMGDTR